MMKCEELKMRYYLFICLEIIIIPGNIRCNGVTYDFYVEEEKGSHIIGYIPISKLSEVVFSDLVTATFISINKTDGYIASKGKIDRELLKQNSFHFVILEPSGQIEVNIHILDINDNSPTFLGNQTISIYESTDIGRAIQLKCALDIDDGNNGLIGAYEVEDGNENNTFRIDYVQPARILYLIYSEDFR